MRLTWKPRINVLWSAKLSITNYGISSNRAINFCPRNTVHLCSMTSLIPTLKSSTVLSCHSHLSGFHLSSAYIFIFSLIFLAKLNFNSIFLTPTHPTLPEMYRVYCIFTCALQSTCTYEYPITKYGILFIDARTRGIILWLLLYVDSKRAKGLVKMK